LKSKQGAQIEAPSTQVAHPPLGDGRSGTDDEPRSHCSDEILYVE